MVWLLNTGFTLSVQQLANLGPEGGFSRGPATGIAKRSTNLAQEGLVVRVKAGLRC